MFSSNTSYWIVFSFTKPLFCCVKSDNRFILWVLNTLFKVQNSHLILLKNKFQLLGKILYLFNYFLEFTIHNYFNVQFLVIPGTGLTVGLFLLVVFSLCPVSVFAWLFFLLNAGIVYKTWRSLWQYILSWWWYLFPERVHYFVHREDGGQISSSHLGLTWHKVRWQF